MDNDTREAFGTLSGQMSGIAKDSAQAAASSRETLVAVTKLGGRVERLEKHVFGSDPPPPDSPPRPVVQRITNSEGELAELAGQVVAVKALTIGQNDTLETHGTKIDGVNGRVAKLEGKVDELLERPDAAQVIVTEMRAAAKTPLGQKLIGAMAAVALGALSLVGYELKARVAKIEEQTAHSVPAILISSDGGAP